MQHGLIYADLIEHYDKVLARQYYEANEEALNSMEAIIKEHDISCDFTRCDALLFTRDAVQTAKLQEEYQAYLDLHIPCTYIDKTDAPFPMAAGLRMQYQARFDPYAYGCALASIANEGRYRYLRAFPCNRYAGGGARVSAACQQYERPCGYRYLCHPVSFYRSGPFLFYPYVLRSGKCNQCPCEAGASKGYDAVH